jgi:phospholipid transport system substrate-binding protein
MRLADRFAHRGATALALSLALALGALWQGGASRAHAAEPVGRDAAEGVAGGPLAATRVVLERTHAIVVGTGDRNQKLADLKQLLQGFLDTDALARQAMGKNLEGHKPEQVKEFLSLFRDLFVRTYVQRLLLFEAPDFAYAGEKVDGDEATVETEIVTARDRFAVSYKMKKSGGVWRATDILVEEVSLAENFRSQFAAILAKDSFEGLLDRLRKKLGEKPNAAGI